jgi:lipopolysaccharide/colanic/teichoic acid biosynthesis glycosyltransferase
VTSVGRLLRKTSLDELPQLFNVVKGDMSLVGPRPSMPYEVEVYKPWHFQRLQALPGITGLAQISGRSSLPFKDIVQIDLDYIENRSIPLDLSILLQTLPVVLSGKGAR